MGSRHVSVMCISARILLHIIAHLEEMVDNDVSSNLYGSKISVLFVACE